MIRKFSALLAALAFALTTLAPVSDADARDRRGGYHHRDYDRHDRYRHRGRDHGDAVAAGAVGLILGLAIGSLASQPRDRDRGCYDNYQRCAPPPPCRNPCGYDNSGYDARYDDDRYRDERYDDRSAYESDYGYDDSYEEPRQQCTRRERQWDRYAGRYVTVDVRC
jgi:hypothetical protein